MDPSQIARNIACITVLLATIPAASMADPAQVPARAWKKAAAWQAGNDAAALLAIEHVGMSSFSDPVARAAHAARLAALLQETSTTPDAKRWACLQLRFVGTAAEVEALAVVMAGSDATLADTARQALEGIHDPAATQALRKALPEATGPLQAGMAAALGRRRDSEAVPTLAGLAESADQLVATAAIRALGQIGDTASLDALARMADAQGEPVPPPLAAALVQAASKAKPRGDVAARVWQRLAAPTEPSALRQAAAVATLEAADAKAREAMILDWLAGADLDRLLAACGRLDEFDDAIIERVLAEASRLQAIARLAVVTAAARRRSPTLLKSVASRIDDPVPEVRAAAVEGLTVAMTPETVPLIVKAAVSDPSELVQIAVRGGLAALPQRLVSDEVVAMLGSSSVANLARVGGPAAWTMLARLAVGDDEAAAHEALTGLEQLTEPTPDGLTKLVGVYVDAESDARRDAVARAIARVVKQLAPPSGFDPAEVVVTAMERASLAEPLALPLVGRLGGSKSLARIDAGLGSSDPAVREAAAAALCNWPTAEVAERLRDMAGAALADAATRAAGRRSLRAHVRVISLPSDRPPAETLALLQAAMQLASAADPEDRGLVLERTAAAVRTMPAVEWIAGYLDAEAVTDSERQAACRALVALAHHRGLRQPNAARFATILNRVAEIVDDPAIADRARRYQAGL